MIKHPKSGKSYAIDSERGQHIYHKYYQQGGVTCSTLRKKTDPKCDDNPDCQWVVNRGCLSSHHKKKKGIEDRERGIEDRERGIEDRERGIEDRERGIEDKKKKKKKKVKEIIANETITLTFCESGENHLGMEQLGEKANEGDGFDLDDLEQAQQNFELVSKVCGKQNPIQYELHDLRDLLRDDNGEYITENEPDPAYILVLRRGVSAIVGNLNSLWDELTSFEWDTKYWDTRRKKVLNKNARANVCFWDKAQEPDYENKKGSIIAYQSLPLLNKIRNSLEPLVGPKAKDMVCEGNRYFDLKKCGIGFHGDAERRRVIALRLGASMPMQWVWFQKSKAIGKKLELNLNNGDMYIMSEKAVGTDWKLTRNNRLTLRHAAGTAKYLKEKR